MFKSLRDKAVQAWNSLSDGMKSNIRLFLIALVIGLVLGLLASCGGDSSAPTRIARNGQEIQKHTQDQRELAESAKHSAVQIVEEAGSNPTVSAHASNIVSSSDQIVFHAGEIDKASRSVVLDSTRVEGKVPWWGTAINRIALVLLVVVAFFALWYSGALNFIRRWIGALSPSTLGQAKLDAEAYERNREDAALAAAIAAKRSRSPEYDAAFQKVRKEHKLSK